MLAVELIGGKYDGLCINISEPTKVLRMIEHGELRDSVWMYAFKEEKDNKLKFHYLPE